MLDAIKNTFDYRDLMGIRRPEDYEDSNSSDTPHQNTPQVPQQPQPVNTPKQSLVKWIVPNKLPHSGIDPKIRRSLMIVGLVVGIILLIMQEFTLIFAVASLIFVSYVISSTPAEQVEHEISNLGVSYAGEFFPWSDLSYYYMDFKINTPMLCIARKSGPTLVFVIRDGDKDAIQQALYDYLPYLDAPPKDNIEDFIRNIISKFTIPA